MRATCVNSEDAQKLPRAVSIINLVNRGAHAPFPNDVLVNKSLREKYVSDD